MANDNLKKFVEDATADTGRNLRLYFLQQPLCEMQARNFTAAERLILFSMDRQLIRDSIAPPKSLDAYQVESNWPPLGDFDFDPFAGGAPQTDCRDPNWTPPLSGGGGNAAPSPTDPDPGAPTAFADPFAQGAGQAWGDPEPHLVNIKPEEAKVGQQLMVVGEGMLPEGKIYLVDENDHETPLDNWSANPAIDDYYCASFRRTYMRGKVPNLPTGKVYTVRVRNAPKGSAVPDDEHFIGYGPAFKIIA